MSTTQPEALRLADALDGNATTNWTREEAAAELRRLHHENAHADRYAEQLGRELSKATAEIAALRAQLASIGAGYTAADMATAAAQGFRDGVASVAASAGSEPVAWPKDATEVREFVGGHFRSLFYANPTSMDPHENDVYELTAHDLLSAFRWWEDLQPSPPEGAGWMPIETAPVAGLILLAVEDSAGERRVFAADASHENGGWVWNVTLGWLGWSRLHSGWTPILWRRLPPPPTTSAGSGKGE